MSRADAAKAALAASVAARDANGAREILERALSELPLLAGAVEALNEGLAAINERLSDMQSSKAEVTAQVADLKSQVDALARIVKKDGKKKGRVDQPRNGLRP